MPLVSIIVPVYKVEKYLKRCVDSLTNQTLRDIEIILVDDGSPDSCSTICDEYAEKDERIKVIHKENGGVSSARNAGIDAAAGEYIGFVDSDDWIEQDMFERLMKNTQQYDADVSVCGLFVAKEQYSAMRPIGHVEKITGRQAQISMLESHPLMIPLINKLYRRELLPFIQNDVGQAFGEDMFANYRVLGNSKTVVIDSTPEYHCIPRAGSAVYADLNQGHLDAVKKAHELLDKVRGDRNLERAWRRRCTVLELTALNRIIKARRMTEQFRPIRQALLQRKKEIIFDRGYTRREKAQTLALWLCPGLYAWAVRRAVRSSQKNT